jgi:hypothetical protein
VIHNGSGNLFVLRLRQKFSSIRLNYVAVVGFQASSQVKEACIIDWTRCSEFTEHHITHQAEFLGQREPFADDGREPVAANMFQLHQPVHA